MKRRKEEREWGKKGRSGREEGREEGERGGESHTKTLSSNENCLIVLIASVYTEKLFTISVNPIIISLNGLYFMSAGTGGRGARRGVELTFEESAQGGGDSEQFFAGGVELVVFPSL